MLRYGSGINQLVVDELDGLFPDSVHVPHPFHLVVFFELFCDAVLTCKLFYKLRKKSPVERRLFRQRSRIRAECSMAARVRIPRPVCPRPRSSPATSGEKPKNEIRIRPIKAQEERYENKRRTDRPQRGG